MFRTGFRRATVKEEAASAQGLELATGGGARKKIPTMCSIAQLHTSDGGSVSLLSLEQRGAPGHFAATRASLTSAEFYQEHGALHF